MFLQITTQDDKMIHHEKSLDFNATPQEIWTVLSRFMHINEFAPLITSVEALTEGENGMGSKRRCHFENDTSMAEEVIKWNVNEGYAVRLSELTPMPLHEAVAEIKIERLGDKQSRVIWGMDYRVKYGLFGWLLGQTMMKLMMGKIINQNLKGLSDNVLLNQKSAD